MTRVLITAPLRQDPDIFDAYQDSLDRLIIPDGVTVDRFFVVNNCPEVIPRIRGAAFEQVNTGLAYEKTDNDHIWTYENMWAMGGLRNRTIHQAYLNDYDYWFSIDTDLVVHPMTLQWLLWANKDIVSEIFWTRAPSGKEWCNAWMMDQCSGMPEEWKKPGLYPCGMTGALMLAKTDIFANGVSYDPIPNINKALRGEDRHFCVRAACAGYQLWIDTHCPALHLYTRGIYNDYIKAQAEMKG